jgi:hypothetical protein
MAPDSPRSNIDARAKREKQAQTDRIQTWANSPFSIAPAAAPDAVQLRVARRARMSKEHYETPANYYTMSLKQLDKLARTQDAYALTQLGEQYWSEAGALQWDPDFDYAESPKNLAIKYFERAIQAGHFRLGFVVAKKWSDAKNPVEAQAWQLVSERLAVAADDQYYQQARISLTLTVQQRADAKARAEKITSELGLPGI